MNMLLPIKIPLSYTMFYLSVIDQLKNAVTFFELNSSYVTATLLGLPLCFAFSIVLCCLVAKCWSRPLPKRISSSFLIASGVPILFGAYRWFMYGFDSPSLILTVIYPELPLIAAATLILYRVRGLDSGRIGFIVFLISCIFCLSTLMLNAERAWLMLTLQSVLAYYGLPVVVIFVFLCVEGLVFRQSKGSGRDSPSPK